MQNQEKIIQAIADVINKKGTDDFGMLPWCKPSDLIAELAAAIAPHLEGGAGVDEPRLNELVLVDGRKEATYKGKAAGLAIVAFKKGGRATVSFDRLFKL